MRYCRDRSTKRKREGVKAPRGDRKMTGIVIGIVIGIVLVVVGILVLTIIIARKEKV